MRKFIIHLSTTLLIVVSIGTIANAESISAAKLLKMSLNYQSTTDFQPEVTIALAGGPPPRPRPQPNRPQAPQTKPQAPQNNNNQNGQNQNGQNGQSQNGQSGQNSQEESSGITIKLPSIKFPFGGK
jgi:hypothetical protein